jgi:hypothetical protein
MTNPLQASNNTWSRTGQKSVAREMARASKGLHNIHKISVAISAVQPH